MEVQDLSTRLDFRHHFSQHIATTQIQQCGFSRKTWLPRLMRTR